MTLTYIERLLWNISLNSIASFTVAMLNSNIYTDLTAVFTKWILTILYIPLHAILSLKTLERNIYLVSRLEIATSSENLTSCVHSEPYNYYFASLIGLMEWLESRIYYLPLGSV